MEAVRREIIHLNLKTKDLIQEIQNCKGPIEELNELNFEGRKNISLLRDNLAILKSVANEEEKPIIRQQLLEEVKNYEDELATTIIAFKKANVNCLIELDKSNRNELFGTSEEALVRNRRKKDKENVLKMSSDVTDQLLSISRTLADSTKRSADTLDTLVNSSTTVEGTRGELDNTGSVISQSGKLLAKYGRREKTDKALVFFAFAFFLACVFYIIQKRLF